MCLLCDCDVNGLVEMLLWYIWYIQMWTYQWFAEIHETFCSGDWAGAFVSTFAATKWFDFLNIWGIFWQSRSSFVTKYNTPITVYLRASHQNLDTPLISYRLFKWVILQCNETKRLNMIYNWCINLLKQVTSSTYALTVYWNEGKVMAAQKQEKHL